VRSVARARSAVLAPFFPDEELAPRVNLMLVDLYSPLSMLSWAKSQVRLDPTVPARLARLAAFAGAGRWRTRRWRRTVKIAADFAAGLGFGPHVQETVHYQYERYDGRGRAFHQRAEAISLPAQVLHLAQAADVARGLADADKAAGMIRRRAGSYFGPHGRGRPRPGWRPVAAR
jgi:hypothetical protein